VPDGDVIWAGELDLIALRTLRGATTRAMVALLPRFPSIVRDLSIVVEDRLPAADVRATIRANAPSTLVSVPRVQIGTRAKGVARRARQPVDAPDVPRYRAHADR
jgi:hypothetical protein